MKKNTLNQTPPAKAPTDLRQMPLHDEISQHARELWERYGRPSGRDLEIWLEAERQLVGADPKVRKIGAGAVSSPLYAHRASA